MKTKNNQILSTFYMNFTIRTNVKLCLEYNNVHF